MIHLLRLRRSRHGYSYSGLFRNLQEDAYTMARHLQQHIELWVCRAPAGWTSNPSRFGVRS
ncbi:hypothetical protein HU200_035114 [Digitaria exilis]|uniref:Uncharacterized protein n=1 Tax=Digitaria exilis TaxID=1010633 RepID=A0A835ELQ2_9POAL|nr:hypothetical protein HU200_035114 [Digitaria exilis]